MGLVKIGPLVLLTFAVSSLSAQVTYHRMLQVGQDSQNWLTYSGGYASSATACCGRSTGTMIGKLQLKWVHVFDTQNKIVRRER